MQIEPGVHLIPGIIANPYLLIDGNELTVIDTGLAGSDRKILAYIRSLGRSPGDLKRILITHSDRDHIGSLAALRRQTGARVLADTIEAEAIAHARPSRPLQRRGLRGAMFGVMGVFAPQAPSTVDEVISEGQTLPILGGLRVLSTPGHTPGHLSFYLKRQKVLFVGDSLASDGDGLRGSTGWNTWDQSQADASVRMQAKLAPRTVCPGHGPVVVDASGKFPRLPG